MRSYFLKILIIIVVVSNSMSIFAQSNLDKKILDLSKKRYKVAELEWKLLKFYVYTLSAISTDYISYSEILFDSTELRLETDITVVQEKLSLDILTELKKQSQLVRGLLARDL